MGLGQAREGGGRGKDERIERRGRTGRERREGRREGGREGGRERGGFKVWERREMRESEEDGGLGEIEQEREVWERNSSRRLTRRGMETEGGV